MEQTAPRRRARRAVVITAAAAFAVGGSFTASPVSAGHQASSAGDCSAEPIRLSATMTLSGPVAWSGDDPKYGFEAALHAINEACAIGRPIEITVCDDQGDINTSTDCGRAAAEDGSLAYVGSVGNFPEGITASGLPNLLTEGNILPELTGEMSYPGDSGVTLAVGVLTAAAASGADSFLLVTFDLPATQFFASVLAAVAEQFGIGFDTLFFPPDTTDFAPVVAQLAERDPASVGLILSNAVPFFNALESEGISPQDLPMFTSVSIVPQQVIDEVGSAADGMYLITQEMPATATDNEGIATMLAEYEAAGLADNTISAAAIRNWSATHIVADALATLAPEELDALDSQGLVDAVVGLSPIDRPERAVIDLTAPAFGDIEALAAFKIFSREAAVVRVVDGSYEVITDFQDVTEPFTLETN